MCGWTYACGRAIIVEHSNQQVVISMGDKSPKAKDKAKKQDTASKNQKKADASNKANAAAAAKKGK